MEYIPEITKVINWVDLRYSHMGCSTMASLAEVGNLVAAEPKNEGMMLCFQLRLKAWKPVSGMNAHWKTEELASAVHRKDELL